MTLTFILMGRVLSVVIFIAKSSFPALSKMNVPSYVPKSVQLKVGITATYHSNAIDFTACCSTHKYSYVLPGPGFIKSFST